MTDSRPPMHENQWLERIALGLIALVCLVVGGVLYGGPQEALAGSLLRVGAVLGLFLLAWPQVRRVRPWTLALGAGTLLLVMYRPKLLWAVIPLAAILWLLRPRGDRRRATPGESRK